MRYPFTVSIDVGGLSVATLSGFAIIEANADDTPPNKSFPNWTVEAIELCNAEGTPVRLSDGHWLHDRAMMAVLKQHQKHIDTAWGAYMRHAINTSRAGFGLPATH